MPTIWQTVYKELGTKGKKQKTLASKTLALHKFNNHLYLVPRLCSPNPKSYTEHLCLEAYPMQKNAELIIFLCKPTICVLVLY